MDKEVPENEEGRSDYALRAHAPAVGPVMPDPGCAVLAGTAGTVAQLAEQ